MHQTPFNIEPDQRLFYAHLFIRQFFFGIGYLGWAYLVIAGVPILHVAIGILCFRLLQSFVFGYASYELLHKFSAKSMFLLANTLQAGFLLSFYYAPAHILLFSLTVLLAAFYDSLYYSIRDNLERLTAPQEHIANNVGVAGAVSITSDVAGIMFFAYFLTNPSLQVFLFAAAGTILSYIPVHFIKRILIVSSKESFIRRMTLSIPIKTFLTQKHLLILLGYSVVSEFMEFLPILLAHIDIELITIGAVYSLMKLGAAVGSLIAGKYENMNKSSIFYTASILTMSIFAIFIFLPPKYLSLFFLLFGIFGSVWHITIRTKVQKYISKKFEDCMSGGVFLQWIDASYRSLAHPIIITLLLTTSEKFHVGMFAFSILFIIFSMLQNPSANPARAV